MLNMDSGMSGRRAEVEKSSVGKQRGILFLDLSIVSVKRELLTGEDG